MSRLMKKFGSWTMLIMIVCVAGYMLAGCRSKGENASANRRALSEDVETIDVNGVSFDMVRIDGGSFLIGSNDPDSFDDERPVHREDVKSFYIGKTEVTQSLWHAVMDDNPSHTKGWSLPVECVSWDDCQEFIKKLNEMTGLKFRLPTEAEWEFAARGGNRSKGYKYSGGNGIDSVGWYEGNSMGKTHAVGQKIPNELGLCDMSGNVREWTNDGWSDDYKSPRIETVFVGRGGSWRAGSTNCRITYRGDNDRTNRFANLGLRLAI